MPVPIICAAARLCQFAARCARCFSKSQRQYFVMGLRALLLRREPRTVSARHRAVAADRSRSGLSRWLAAATWDPVALPATWTADFRRQ